MLQTEIDKIKFLLKKVLSDLDLVESGEFQKNFDNAKERMISFQKLKNELIKDYPVEELKKYDAELTMLTKQINNKYDNIIEVKKKLMQEIELRMKLLQNRKKLINYSR